MTRQILLVVFLLFTFLPVTSQSYFGRNKVQYRQFDWKIMKTSHFDIYYDSAMEELASIGAGFAEEAFRSLTEEFGEPVFSRIPLIFYASPFYFEQTNTTEGLIPPGVGGFFEFLKGRVVLPADGNLFRFRHVIRHELVHVFTFRQFNSRVKDFRIPDQRFYPLWFTEGLAEFLSGDLPDVQSRMLMRDVVLSDQILRVSEFGRVSGTYLMYKLGEHFLHFLTERYGRQVIRRILENSWQFNDFNQVLLVATGRSVQQLDDEWVLWLKRRYQPLLTRFDPARLVIPSVQTKGFSNIPKVFSDSTGSWCIYINNQDGYTSLYRSKLEAFSSGDPVTETTLVFRGERGPEAEWIKPFDSGFDINPTGRIALVAKSGESDVIHLFSHWTPQDRQTVTFQSVIKVNDLAWSPDGSRLVFSALDQSGMQDLYLYDPENQVLVRLTDDFYDDRRPVFSPDGEWVLFSTDRVPMGLSGAMGLAGVRVSGGPIWLLNDPGMFSENFLSSDASGLILFNSDREGATNVWAVHWSHLQSVLATPTASTAKPWAGNRVTGFASSVFSADADSSEILLGIFERFSFQIRRMETQILQEELQMVPVRNHQWFPHESKIKTNPSSGDYSNEYAFEIAQGAVYTDPLFGTVGGIAIAYGDVLGDDRYFMTLSNTAESTGEIFDNFNVSIARILRSDRTNYSVGFFHYRGRRYDFSDPDVYFKEKLVGGYLGWSYPLSRFDRIESSTAIAWSIKESLGYPTIFGGGLELESGGTQRESWLVSQSIGYVYDNSLWAFTGPLDGYRFGLTAGYTTDFRYNKVNYYTLLADFRHYWRLSDRSTLASRLQARYNDGDEARRFFMIGSWDIRGYSNYDIRGRKLWQMNHELRFPLMDNLGLWFPIAAINFPYFRGALFADTGNAWDDRFTGNLGSYGAGIRWALGGALVLRYDFGKTWQQRPFQPNKGLFHQFFFGWDF